MTTTRVVTIALLAGLALAGCSAGSSLGNQPTLAASRVGTLGLHPNHTTSWMKPGTASQKLLYISDIVAGDVQVYTYPGVTSAGVLTGFSDPDGECTDRAGNVWIVDAAGKIFEYAHGGTSPINVLQGLHAPISCSINVKTGDLAVATFDDSVSVFHNAQGTPTVYSDANFANTYYVGYDNAGNLFVDGHDALSTFHYAVLPAGSSTFTDITLSTVPSEPGNVQWDGAYMAVGDQSSTVYRTQGANVVGTLTLPTVCLRQFYIAAAKKRIIAPDPCNANADVFAYPAGGPAIKTVSGGLSSPIGAVISL
jgi:hypothetical protein